MAPSDSKTAEFAKLFDLFERLASRRSRGQSSSLAMDDVRSVHIPTDLAPVIQNLATIVGTRKHRSTSQHSAATRPRRNTVAVTGLMPHDESDCEDEESLAKFPLEKQYPFTFKMMLHKLYALEEWANKVKEVVERSQVEYKPLAEQEAERSMEVEEEESPLDGRVHFKAGGNGGGSQRRGLLQTRPRSQSVVTSGTGLASPIQTNYSMQKDAAHGDDVRALKKRCVGRRKSMSGLATGEGGMIGNGWIYDATVSSSAMEFGHRGPTIQFDASILGDGQKRSRYQSLESKGKKGARPLRRVSAGAPGIFAGPWLPASGSNIPEGVLVKRRRALTVADINCPDGAQRMKMKRSLPA